MVEGDDFHFFFQDQFLEWGTNNFAKEGRDMQREQYRS